MLWKAAGCLHAPLERSICQARCFHIFNVNIHSSKTLTIKAVARIVHEGASCLFRDVGHDVCTAKEGRLGSSFSLQAKSDEGLLCYSSSNAATVCLGQSSAAALINLPADTEQKA